MNQLCADPLESGVYCREQVCQPVIVFQVLGAEEQSLKHGHGSRGYADTGDLLAKEGECRSSWRSGCRSFAPLHEPVEAATWGTSYNNTTPTGKAQAEMHVTRQRLEEESSKIPFVALCTAELDSNKDKKDRATMLFLGNDRKGTSVENRRSFC